MTDPPGPPRHRTSADVPVQTEVAARLVTVPQRISKEVQDAVNACPPDKRPNVAVWLENVVLPESKDSV